MKSTLSRIFAFVLCLCLALSAAAFALAEGEKIVLRMAWWGGDSRHTATIEAIEAYQKLHPNVTIEPEYVGNTTSYLTKLYAALAADTAPDIVQIDYKWLKDFTDQKQNFVNLFDYADALPLDEIDSTILNTYCVKDGFMLGVPIGLNALCINTNIAALESLGVDYAQGYALTEPVPLP